MTNNPSHDTRCPRGTAWCTAHLAEPDQCASDAVDISTSCSVWLLQELAGVEPTVAVDATGAVSLSEAQSLSRVLGELCAQAGGSRGERGR